MLSRTSYSSCRFAIRTAPYAKNLAMRTYVSQTPSHKTVVSMDSVAPPSSASFAAPSSDAHLKTLSKRELFSLGIIGVATTSNLMLNLVIKMFPYVPMPIVKLLVSSLYCGGDNFEEVKEAGKRLQQRGVNNMMLSLTIEDAEGTKNIDINYIVKETIASIHKVLRPNLEEQLATAKDVNSIPPGYVALKPSALVSNPAQVLLNFENPEWKEQRDTLINNCAAITEEVYKLNQEFAAKYSERTAPFFVSTIDAEKYDLQRPGVYELQRILFSKFNPKSSRMVSCIGTWQLYLSDSAKDLERDYARAEKEGYKLGLKLVRGAYIHSEPDRATVIQPSKEATDENYNSVMTTVIQDLLKKGEDSTYGHLVVATHNYKSQILATNFLKAHDKSPGKANVVLGQLLGMSDNVTHDLITNHGAKNIIKYVPWGPPLETKDYLLRRLQENGDAVRADNGWPLVKAVARTFFSTA